MRLNLLVFRKKLGYNQAEFGKILGLSKGQFYKIENGLHNPSWVVVENFHKAFPEEDIWKIFDNEVY